ncbi:MAG: 30S ribosomal protein S13, partial [Candidatus Zambryskibacteria bacterium]|nr:30S ribosomal protein S13 [Candidatus Zambryskibacteria bacterium]
MRILGITIPDEKRLEIGLTTLYGVGRSRAKKILGEAGVPIELKSKEATIDQENKIRSIIETLVLEGDLKREVGSNVKRLKDIKAYRGVRHQRGLPVRGQRTKSKSRTTRPYRGRKTMGTGRKLA